MRTRRILGYGPSCYHVMSRIVDRRFIFDEQEKDRFRDLMRRLERFCGVEVMTYAIMSNHFHILVRIPDRIALTDRDFEDRLAALYTRHKVDEVLEQIRTYRRERRDDLAESVRQPYIDRMYSLSCFVKELKQRFTQGYNCRHERRGTLWEERFRSLLVQGSRRALTAVAAYIDLNAVRAGICEDPAAYRYCGYGEAIGGGTRAQWGLQRIVAVSESPAGPEQVLTTYRTLLVPDSDVHERADTPAEGVSEFNPANPLYYRVRYFSFGAVMGSRRFVNELSELYKAKLGRKRHAKARPMQGGDWGGLCVLRDREA